MRLTVIGGVAVLAACLGGCNRRPADWLGLDGASHSTRYVGVGIYSPGTMWTKLVMAQQPKAPTLAKPVDDQAVIVVVDSHTGEIRSCGDLTGYCVGMNPWKTPLTPAQSAPVSLTTHYDELPSPSIEVHVTTPKKHKAPKKPAPPSPPA